MESKEQKKLLKAQKKAEKLAKLEAKKNIVIPVVKKEKKPLSNGYDPTDVEKHWTDYWLTEQSYRPENTNNNLTDNENIKKFVMVMPPPNITGSLHIGHAMMIAIQDFLVRFKRLNGHEVLFLPGLDHAGIATQNVVMKSIANKEVTRDEFLKEAFAWSEKYSNRIIDQLNRMGASLDYTRKVFTLDPKINRSVNVAFCELYKKGLIYRDNKIVNWCGKLKTSLSDLEVSYKNVSGGSVIEVDNGKHKFGLLYYFKYYLSRSTTVDINNISNLPYVIVATSRPETILGDSAICINPNDPRFNNIDKIFELNCVEDLFNEDNKSKLNENTSEAISKSNITEIEEIKNERKNKYKTVKNTDDDIIERKEALYAVNPLTYEVIPVIFDSQADLNFGTGILKVTPSNDPVDFKLGRKHKLKFNKIMDDENRIIHSMYKNVKRFEARQLIIEELKKRDMFIKEEEYDQILPFCSRSNDIIESMIKEQWWCDCKTMAKKALDAVRNKEIEVFPEEAENIWYKWLENIKDWCLSRQLWWGHRIPAYLAKGSDGKEEWIVAENDEEAKFIAKEKGYDIIKQDDDVLDTWFSSGLWPFSTLGWPDKTIDFEKYFPNSLLETGSDIFFFWVARMVMLSYELTGKRPFDRIFLHGIVRDAHGIKMSKSVGNVIDPLYVIEGITLDEMISNLQKGNLDKRELRRATDALRKDYPNGIQKCGSDALRFTLLSYTNGMKDINLDILRVQGYSRFCNKIWNAYKFISKLCGTELDDNFKNLNIRSELKIHQKWFIERMNKTISEQYKNIDCYNFMASSQSVYSLFFDFCDVIIEVSKNCVGNDKLIIYQLFIRLIKMLNPYMPFITEEIHCKFYKTLISDYPQIIVGDFTNNFEDVLSIARICRSNKKTMIEKGPYFEYFKILAKDSVEEIENLEDYESIGSIKYKIVE